MSWIFRRPHDYRQVPVAVAALFDGGAPPEPDSPPLARSDAQERHFAARTPDWSPRQRAWVDPVVLFPEEHIDEPAIPMGSVQDIVHAGLRPVFTTPRATPWTPALFEAAPVVDSPPIPDLAAQRAWWTAFRARPDEARTLREFPNIPEFDLVFGRGVEQELFHIAYRPGPTPQQRPVEPPFGDLGDPTPPPGLAAQEALLAILREPWRRRQDRPLDPALFPAETVQDPPIPGLGAQEAWLRVFRPYPLRPQGAPPLDPALYPPVVVDDPPIAPLFAQEAFLRTFRPWPWRPQGGSLLVPSLYPVVVADDPPIPGLFAQEAFLRAYRPVYVHPTGNGSVLVAQLLEALDCCGTTLLRLNDIDAALVALSVQITDGFADVTTILSAMAADIAVLKIRREEAGVDPTKMLQELKLLVLDLEKKVRRINRPY